MVNLGEKFANYEEKSKDIRSSQASEAVSQIVESIRDQEKEAKSCYDFTYFPINKNKLHLNLERTFTFSSKDYDADPAANLSSDGKSAISFRIPTSSPLKKQSIHTVTSPLNLISPTFQGYLQSVQV